MQRLTASLQTLHVTPQVPGSPGVDLHHLDILALVDDIAIAAEIGTGRRETEKAVSSLLSTVGADLLAEEYLMSVTGYPALYEQQQAHRRFAERLSASYSAGCEDAAGLDALLECVREWVCGHGSSMDRQFETYLLSADARSAEALA